MKSMVLWAVSSETACHTGWTPSSGLKSKQSKKTTEPGGMMIMLSLLTAIISACRFLPQFTLSPWRQRRYIPLKRQALPNYMVLQHKRTTLSAVPAMRTSNSKKKHLVCCNMCILFLISDVLFSCIYTTFDLFRHVNVISLNISIQHYVELIAIQCRTYQVAKYCAVLYLTTRLNQCSAYTNYLCLKHKTPYLAYSYGQEIKRKLFNITL
jgi:hypothetical protein